MKKRIICGCLRIAILAVVGGVLGAKLFRKHFSKLAA